MWIAYDLYSSLYPIMANSSHYRRFIPPIQHKPLNTPATHYVYLSATHSSHLIPHPSIHPSIRPCYPHHHCLILLSLDCIKIWETLLMLLYKLFSVVYAATLMGDDGLFLALVGSWVVVMSTDHLDPITWTISTPPLGSPQRHQTSLALPKLQCWVGDWLNVLRSRQISYSLSRLALSVLNFHSLHGQHMHSEFGVGPPSCLDLARGSSYPPSIKRILTITHRHPLKCCCFGSPFRLSPIPIFSLVIALNKILQL